MRWRAPLLKSPAGFEGTAREAFLLYNNILLVVAAAMVFVGTLAPLIADALGMPRDLGGLAVLRHAVPDRSCCRSVALVAIGIHAALEARAARRSARGASLSGFGAGAGASAWYWCYGVYGAGQAAHADRHGARRLGHPVVAVRSHRSPASQAHACRAPSSA